MKNWIVLAAAGLLMAAAPALADDHHDQNNNGARPAHANEHGAPNAHAAGPAPNHMARPTGPMSGPVSPPNHGAMTMHHNDNNAMRHAPAPTNSMQNNAMQNNAMHRAPNTNNAMQNNAMRRAPATTMQRGVAPHANHANFGALNRNFNAPRRYHASAYHRPQGWYAHRWTYGERLPAAFFARNYWLTDFGAFGLISPPPGCVWVRYGDDALLIDEYTGEVIQVEYGAFY